MKKKDKTYKYNYKIVGVALTPDEFKKVKNIKKDYKINLSYKAIFLYGLQQLEKEIK